jgi:hypothetical protein
MFRIGFRIGSGNLLLSSTRDERKGKQNTRKE